MRAPGVRSSSSSRGSRGSARRRCGRRGSRPPGSAWCGSCRRARAAPRRSSPSRGSATSSKTSTRPRSRRSPVRSGRRSRWRCCEPVPAGAPPEPRAIARRVPQRAARAGSLGPVLVAVDDLQWQDSASTQALAFAARRLDGEPVSFLLARRPGVASELERALERREPERLDIGPLGLDGDRTAPARAARAQRSPPAPAPHRRGDARQSAVRARAGAHPRRARAACDR